MPSITLTPYSSPQPAPLPLAPATEGTATPPPATEETAELPPAAGHSLPNNQSPPDLLSYTDYDVDQPTTEDHLKDLLKRMPKLQNLVLQGSFISITDKSLPRLLQVIPPLNSLSLMFCNITDAGLAILRNMQPQLRCLQIGHCGERITDEGVALFADAPQLQKLQLKYCKGITNEVIAHLKGLTCLQHLAIYSKSDLDGPWVASLRTLPKTLKSLTLGYRRNTALSEEAAELMRCSESFTLNVGPLATSPPPVMQRV